MKLIRKFIIGFIALLLFGCFENPKRDRYLIPEGFRGTIRIYYRVADAPALPMGDGYRLVNVPPSGTVKTSSDIMPGKFHDEFLLVTSIGRKIMPPDKLGGGATNENTKTGEIFFWTVIQ